MDHTSRRLEISFDRGSREGDLIDTTLPVQGKENLKMKHRQPLSAFINLHKNVNVSSPPIHSVQPIFHTIKNSHCLHLLNSYCMQLLYEARLCPWSLILTTTIIIPISQQRHMTHKFVQDDISSQEKKGQNQLFWPIILDAFLWSLNLQPPGFICHSAEIPACLRQGRRFFYWSRSWPEPTLL